MKFLRSLWCIFFLFLFLRFAFIFTFPPFTDESLYIRWGQLMVWNPDFRFASIVYHSRQPLAFWLFGLGSIATGNPLIGGRLVSFLISIPSFFALFSFMKKSYGEHTALLSVLLLAVSPLAIMFQSLALMDGMLFNTAFCIVYLINKHRLQKNSQTRIMLGIILGTLVWIKTTALFIFLSTLLATLPRISSIVFPVLFISLPLTFLPHATKMISEPGSFSFSLQELAAFPMLPWIQNIAHALYGYSIYFTPTVFLFGLIGAYTYRKEKPMTALYCFGLTILLSILLGKIFRIRYALYSMIGVIPFATLYLTRCSSSSFIRRLLYGVCIGSSFLMSLVLIIQPKSFFLLFPENSWASREKEYAYGWTSGKAVKTLEKFIEKIPKSMQQKIILLTEDAPGNPSDYLLARYYFDPTILLPCFQTVG